MIKLTGLVQGVGCRYYCAGVGRRSGVHGSATNMADGSVKVVGEVPDQARAEEFARALKNNSFNIPFWGSIDTVSVFPYSGSLRGDVNF